MERLERRADRAGTERRVRLWAYPITFVLATLAGLLIGWLLGFERTENIVTAIGIGAGAVIGMLLSELARRRRNR